ncbi:hypothetical protein TNCV_3771751 [Trichonephila clavipes]|nr:hypothetical protein TNCV_3771751 [Trichonephila clavipes]
MGIRWDVVILTWRGTAVRKQRFWLAKKVKAGLPKPMRRGLFEEVEDSGLQSDDEYHPDEKGSKRVDTDDIPLDYKIKRWLIWERAPKMEH